MFDRPHHRRISKLLALLDRELMARTDCAFAGGTYISMALGEFRRSGTLGLLCMSQNGYAELRALLSDDPTALFRGPVTFMRELRMEPYRLHSFLEIEGCPIRFEIFVEHRIAVSAVHDETLGLPCLSIPDLYAEKLLACADRVLDKSTNSRDILDLAMMICSWGPIPPESIDKAAEAYGQSVATSFRKGLGLLMDPAYLGKAMTELDMDPALSAEIVFTLEEAALGIGRSREEDEERARRSAATGAGGTPADPLTFAGAEGAALLRGIEDCKDLHGKLSWPLVERIAIDRALSGYGSKPHEIAGFLAANSPGAAYPERHDALLRIAEERAGVLAALGPELGQ